MYAWPPGNHQVFLEDCRTLENGPYSIAELPAIGLSMAGAPESRTAQ